jgi:type I restriction enzyme S subunit
MIADLKPYPEYKESGLPRLGQVPGHWDVSPLAGLARVKSVVHQSERQLLSVYLQRGVVRFADVDEKRTNPTSEDLSNYQAVDPGDFVLNNQQAWRGSVGVSDYSGIISPAYLVLALSQRYSTRYANLLFRDQSMVSQYLVCSKGVGTIQRNLYWPHLKRVGVVVPPPDEQAAIVRFLDWTNGRLERAIRAKRKVIALLNEQKQAIIHRAVTRGLDPSAPLKPSGISWLGDIPRHWDVRKLRSLFRLQGSGTTPSGEQFYGGSTNWVMSGDLNDSEVRRTKRTVQEVALETYSTLKLYPPGSLVVAMYGATIGKTGILGEPACTNQACCVLAQPADNANVRFVQLAVQIAKPHLVSEAYGGGQPNVNAEVVRSLRIGLPPAEEQERILGSVADSTGHLDITISRLEREIELLREYRTRLVADVVTGKLDVREAAAQLPAEDGEDKQEPLDEDEATLEELSEGDVAGDIAVDEESTA